MWYYLKVCKLCLCNNSIRNEDWKFLNEARGLRLTIKDSEFSPGLYMCKMSPPYHVDKDTTLQVEITKTFEVELAGNISSSFSILCLINFLIYLANSQVPPPEIFNDTSDRFEVDMNSAVVLQCKFRSTKPTTIKWFKQKSINVEDDDNSHSFMEIKYFENFYQPLPQVGLKLLDDNVYLSKLTISNVTEEVSRFVCVSINYSHKFSCRNFTVHGRKRKSLHDLVFETNDDDDEEEDELEINNNLIHDDRSFELLFIPLIFLLIVIIQVSAIVYLLIYRRLMKNTNKNPIIH